MKLPPFQTTLLSLLSALLALHNLSPILLLATALQYPTVASRTPSETAETIANNQIIREHSDMVKKGLLRRFGLENVPMQSGPSLKIPEHVWDIYNMENEVDWVRHYYPKEIIDNNPGFILSYNLSVAARNAHNEQVVKAIMKLRLRYTNNNRTRREERNNVSAFYYLNSTVKKLIDTQSIENVSEWIDIDVTNAFTRHQDLVKILIELPDDIEIDESETHSMTSLPYATAQSAPLIIYSEISEPSSVRRKRSTTSNSERRGKKKNRKHQKYDADTSLCRKSELYVDFDELHWNDWIMAPKGYEAGQCQGSCPNPMPGHLNATNHAIIQSLLHSLNPDDVPPPSCVPTELSPLSILYVDIDNVIVIKEYANMRVEACGCR